jgi:hypothetical protein
MTVDHRQTEAYLRIFHLQTMLLLPRHRHLPARLLERTKNRIYQLLTSSSSATLSQQRAAEGIGRVVLAETIANAWAVPSTGSQPFPVAENQTPAPVEQIVSA